MRIRITLSLVAAFLSMGAVATCEPDVIDNPSFDLWCGDQLCGWQVTAGAIEKVSTWHERDYGVGLVGKEVVLTQLVDAGAADLPCVTFELIADARDGADLSLELDFNDDGSVDYSQPIPANDWPLTRFDVATPTWFQGVRFSIAKYGAADAVLAQVRALAPGASACSAPPLELHDRPNGATCDSDGECADAVCADAAWLDPWEGDPKLGEWHALSWTRCGECRTTADCAPTEACGFEATSPDLDSFPACGPAGRHVVGEHCLSDEECATGICADAQCAECRDTCEGTCEPGASAIDVTMPRQCDAGAGQRAKGASCLAGADCASGVCDATDELRLCMPDGRRCSVDADCGSFGVCALVGAYDGTCH